MITIRHVLFYLITFSQALVAFAGYVPTDSILLNSGSSEDAADADGRRWVGDRNDKYRLSSGNSAPARAAYQDPSLPSQVPYMSARVFTSASTYKFSVSGKTRHYVRLHFYPAVYNGMDPADAYFDVAVAGGQLTLLRNFSAYATAKALTQAYIVREFYLPRSPDGILRLTFTPSPEKKGSYAFVNGIEVVSAPDIYAGSEASLVGFSGQDVDVGDSAAVQTMYRLNVGGQYLPPGNDTGLGRAWYDDSPYLFGAAFGVSYAADDNVTVKYPSGVPGYIAPVDVYSTARSMGPDPQVNMNTNLTWIFQVDANFTYVVRLHFCELQLSKINQRVFTIFVNNQTAEAAADVIGWASSAAVPVYKDYAVYVADGAGDEELWVALHPSAASKPEYYDALLNGLEVFKLNDTAGNLAGPNPSPSAMLAAAEEEEADEAAAEFGSGSSSSGRSHVIGGAAGGAAAVGLVFAVCIAVYNRKKRVEGENTGGGGSGWLPLYGGSSGNSRSTITGKSSRGASSHLSSMAASLCRHFSIAEIRQATKNFDESLVIGVGGFGKVYRGAVDGGAMKVAIKRSNPSSEQGVHEFQTEIEMLSKLRHRHLVSLIGYCEENDEMILVYDYMAHGTLREHLYKGGNPSLPWKQRLEICIGAARGLHYLHTGAKYPIIHRDVKTTNILLDDKWVAKVSDFGLSKTGPCNMDQTHVSTVVKGSFGYLDPEYFRRQQLTDKSDVYSFGVVLFEVLCARAALNPSLPKEQVSLADWALHCRRKGTLEDIVDPALKGKVDPECLSKFASTAEKCLSDHGVDRPSMGDILWNLEFALQLQETADQGGQQPKEGDQNGSEAAVIVINNTSHPGLGGHHHHLSGSCAGSELSDDTESLNASAVFSQLAHPKGR